MPNFDIGTGRDAITEREVSQSSDGGQRFAVVAQQQIHLLNEFVPTGIGSALDLAMDVRMETESAPLGLGVATIANWLAEQLSDDQIGTLRELGAEWRRRDETERLELPGLRMAIADVFDGVPYCLDVGILGPKIGWFVNLIGRERLAIRRASDEDNSRVVVFGHVTRALRLGGLSLLVEMMQDAGRLAAGLAAHLEAHGDVRRVCVSRDAPSLRALNRRFGFSGRNYTALATIVCDGWPE